MTSSLKAPLRKEKTGTRLKLHADEWQSLSAQVVKQLQACLPHSSKPVALYYPVRGEVDILPLMQHMDACLPVTVPGSKELIFRKCQIGQHLEKNHHGVMQPAAGAEECHPDTIIVPLVAFDRRGFRIGYGGGYYDITLALLQKKSRITAIGVAFSFQEVKEVPVEPFDAKLDIIVTEKETLSFS